MLQEHHYQTKLTWIGNQGSGTSAYQAYSRNHVISIQDKPDILASSDPTFLGDSKRHNPEEMLVASLSSCHMLWYLHLCADAGIVVTEYSDDANGVMITDAGGAGKFEKVLLKPSVKITNPLKKQIALELHEKAHTMCFIANSVNFPVLCEALISSV